MPLRRLPPGFAGLQERLRGTTGADVLGLSPSGSALIGRGPCGAFRPVERRGPPRLHGTLAAHAAPDRARPERDDMKIAVPKESRAEETRVAITPDVVKRLVQAEHEVVVETGAGALAAHPDSEFEEAGASVGEGVEAGADLVLRVNPPTPEEVARIPEGAALISLLFPLSEHDLVRSLADQKVTAYALDRVPRITRAQSMDVLSSQSTVAGYMAVLMAATRTPRFFPMLTTAAGTIRPAKVYVLGAGVAGLQAIATARRLGAVVKAYDIRAATREQVQSLGADFIDLPDLGDMEDAGGYARALTPEEVAKQQAALGDVLAEADVIITTALVPGRPAPKLITAEMAEKLRSGTVVLDMAAETGGNCEHTKAGEDVELDGVLYLGPVNIPARLPQHASQMFAKNLLNLIKNLAPDGPLAKDLDDDVTVGCMITDGGEVIEAATRDAMGLGERPGPAVEAPPDEDDAPPEGDAEADPGEDGGDDESSDDREEGAEK